MNPLPSGQERPSSSARAGRTLRVGAGLTLLSGLGLVAACGGGDGAEPLPDGSTTGTTTGMTTGTTTGTTTGATTGTTTGTSTGTSTGTTTEVSCVGTPTSSCATDPLCSEMPGCEVTTAAGCAGTALACSSFDEDGPGCEAQWGCDPGDGGVCNDLGYTCDDFSETECDRQSACYWGGFGCFDANDTGYVAGCSGYHAQIGCDNRPGCEWLAGDTLRCPGSAIVCGALGADVCETQAGCSVTPGDCSGTPTPCEDLSVDECASQPGCSLSEGEFDPVEPTGMSSKAPDLAAETFTFARALSGGIDYLRINLAEINRGASKAGPHSLTVYFSEDDVFGGADDIEFRSWDVTHELLPYGVNGAYLNNALLTMPSAGSVPPGFYYVFLRLDPEGAITETEEENNLVAHAPVFVGPTTFDLNAVSVAHDATGTRAPGDAVTLSVVVENLSTTSVPSAAVKSYLSADQLLDGGDRLLSCPTSLSLDLDEQEQGTFPLACTLPRLRGSYYVITELDPSDLLADADRTNNVAVSAEPVVLAAPSPDLVVSSVTYATAPLPWKGSLDLAATVTNQGVDPAPATSLEFRFDGDALCTVSVPALAASASAEVEKSCTFSSTLYGTGAISAHADPSDGIFETSEGNNQASGASLTVSGPNYNLRADGFQLGGTLTGLGTGSIVNFSFDVTTTGSDAMPAYGVGIYASTDTTISDSDTLICTHSAAAQAPDTMLSVTWACALPELSPGSYYVGILADPSDVIDETIEHDNTYRDVDDQIVVTH